MPLVLSKLITNIIFSVYRTPLTLGLYTLIIYTGPLYIWIINNNNRFNLPSDPVPLMGPRRLI